MALTVLQVKNAKPGRHSDGKGLYLLVKPSGSKSWVLRVQVNGRRRDYGLGSGDLLSLAEAREKAAEGRKMAKSGVDPAVEWRREERSIPTFQEAAVQYHSKVQKAWKNGKHGAQWLSTLQNYVFPSIGSRSVAEIDAAAIHAVLLPIWLQIPETARRVRQRTAVVLDYARGQGWRDSEAPIRSVDALMKGIKQPKRGNFAAMPYSEVPEFLAHLRSMDPTVGRKALEFLILTASRSGEVRGAVPEEINWKTLTWEIPADRMKMSEPHAVPLTEEAILILTSLRVEAGGRVGQPIFVGVKGRSLSDATLTKALRSAGGEACTVHGFRSSFRDWVAEQTTFPGDWAEAALAHAVQNKVEAAYKRTKFLEQRRKLMKAWADFVSGAGGKVIKLADQKAAN